MSIELLILSFDKAEEEIGSSKKTHLSQHLSDILQENYKYQINERTLRDYYTNYKNGTVGLQDDLKPKLIVCLCNYLGYEDYVDFKYKTKYEKAKDPKEKQRRLEEIEGKKKGGKERLEEEKKPKLMIVISVSIAFSAILLFSLNENFNNEPEQCMTWADSLYVRVSCNESPLSTYGTQVKPLGEVEFKNMKKVDVNPSYPFFSAEGKPMIWYYKKSSKQIDYFTAPGLHPTNGETLRKITPHIIQTYVPMHGSKKNSFVQ